MFPQFSVFFADVFLKLLPNLFVLDPEPDVLHIRHHFDAISSSKFLALNAYRLFAHRSRPSPS
ncbi:MAG: hypothetical protein QXG35_09735, partial [Nitrososphaerota archaeon]